MTGSKLVSRTFSYLDQFCSNSHSDVLFKEWSLRYVKQYIFHLDSSTSFRHLVSRPQWRRQIVPEAKWLDTPRILRGWSHFTFHFPRSFSQCKLSFIMDRHSSYQSYRTQPCVWNVWVTYRCLVDTLSWSRKFSDEESVTKFEKYRRTSRRDLLLLKCRYLYIPWHHSVWFYITTKQSYMLKKWMTFYFPDFNTREVLSVVEFYWRSKSSLLNVTMSS